MYDEYVYITCGGTVCLSVSQTSFLTESKKSTKKQVPCYCFFSHHLKYLFPHLSCLTMPKLDQKPRVMLEEFRVKVKFYTKYTQDKTCHLIFLPYFPTHIFFICMSNKITNSNYLFFIELLRNIYFY